MKRFNDSLKHVHIASPCNADWDQMIGSERVRFCGQCSLNVYNLSSMSRIDAEQLIEHNEGRLCIRYYRRSDGSIITKNCPVGLRALKRRMSYLARAVSAAILSFLAGFGFSELLSQFPGVEHPFRREVMMGAIAVTPGKGNVTYPTVGVTGERSPVVMGKREIRRSMDGVNNVRMLSPNK
jgi:hypothetical protein